MQHRIAWAPGRRRAACGTSRIGIFAFLFFISWITESGQTVPPAGQAAATSGIDPLRATASRLAGNQAIGNFAASLEAKEAADFLLTPALLMQEAITPGTVLTYPSE